VKQMLAGWEREFPGRVQNIFAALRNVAPGHLADTRLHDFAGLDALRRSAGPVPDAPVDLLALDRIEALAAAT
jgi:tRNA 2-thiocytidine biosynthesis protein TtcA